MSGAAEQLVALVEDADPYSHPADEIADLQLRAANERLEERRGQILVLDRRMRDVGIDAIKTFDDAIPLLFSHTTYKSYPDGFISNERWDRLLKWYDTLAVEPTDKVDLSGVSNIDSWIDALWAAGHRVTASSGTSGKSSFLPATMGDRALIARILQRHAYWPGQPPEGKHLRWYQLTPKTGAYRIVDSQKALSELMADPDKVRYMTDRPMLVSEVSRAARLKRSMIDGTALPGDLAVLEAEAVERADEISRSLEEFARDIAEHHTEPMCIVGNWGQQWRLIQILRKLGVPEGSFHPDTLINGAGGTKGVSLPQGYKDQIYGFYGKVRRPSSYGMSEITIPSCICPAGRYHMAPWVHLLLLDQTGERLMEPDGRGVEGRAAFFDLAVSGRWGGVVSGDKISVDFVGCECGRPGPTIADSITRYMELDGNDDKLSCAGTMEAYVRAVVRTDSDAEGMV